MRIVKIPIMGPTTKLTLKSKDEPLLTGKEKYPILGKVIAKEQIAEIMKRCVGLTKMFDCEKKTKIAIEVLGEGYAICGSLFVVSGDNQSEYGYLFNPPYEFHAWVMLSPYSILDVSVPGVIARGLILEDHVGPFLVDREPCILNGKAPDWMRYVPVERLP